MTPERGVTPTKPRKPKERLPRNEDPAFYEGLGRAIQVARTSVGMKRKELAEAANVSYAYLSDIETGRGRPGSRSLLAIAEALGMSPSILWRQAEEYQAQIAGVDAAPEAQPVEDLESAIARLSARAPSPAARRWFHAGRAIGGAEREQAATLGLEVSAAGEPSAPDVRDQLNLEAERLSDEDVWVLVALARRLGQER
jgi:transcriptional regulator with XRE-family HTH domain